VTSGEEWQRQVRRVRADRAAARRRHPASGRARPDQPGMLRALPSTTRQPAGLVPQPDKETDMPDPTADDHRTQLRALLAQADDYAAALDQIARDDPRRLLDVARQMTTWHAQLATVLLGIVGTSEAGCGVIVAVTLTALAEAAPLIHAEPPSLWSLPPACSIRLRLVRTRRRP
jgi:hypothetical protein